MLKLAKPAFSHQIPNSTDQNPSSLFCICCNIRYETIDHCLLEHNMLTPAHYTSQSKLLMYLKPQKNSSSVQNLADITCSKSTELEVCIWIIPGIQKATSRYIMSS